MPAPELLEQALAALTYQGTMWSTRRQRRMAAVDALRAALEAPSTAPDEIERLRKDAERYRWLAEYLVSDDESHDDAIVAATTVKEVDSVIDNAMKGTP